MTIIANLKGVFTPEAPEDRTIVYLDIEYNGNTYDWMIYAPVDVDFGAYIESQKPRLEAEIDYKENQWATLDPKTRTIKDPITQEETVIPIEKSEIVKPDFPDYYAQRRPEYPSTGDQLGAIGKGITSPEYLLIEERIAAVKAKYPKPPYIS